MCRAPIELVGEAAQRLQKKEMTRKRLMAYLKPYNRILSRRMTNRFIRRSNRVYINVSGILMS